MTDTISMLQARRSIPPVALDGPGPDANQLADMLRIGARVPDHGKLAPWRFIVFEGDARHKAGQIIAAVYRSDHAEATADQLDFERNRKTAERDQVPQ